LITFLNNITAIYMWARSSAWLERSAFNE